MNKALLTLFFFFFGLNLTAIEKPRIFVFTDINIDSGDPDDRQSLIHLLWYSDVLEIEGIIPERLDAKGFEACQLAINAYQKDVEIYQLLDKGFAHPSDLRRTLAVSKGSAIAKLHHAASKDASPLWVLIWGSMASFRDALLLHPEIAPNLRLLTIGTGLMHEGSIPYLPADWEKKQPCLQMNWNADGRNDLFNDPRFHQMWWLEMNWTYEGMFTGDQPAELFQRLTKYGALGQYMRDVVKNEGWAQYFRAGDTPSVLYVIDPANKLEDPTHGSWAGRFQKPFPNSRPNYYTDSCGSLKWDYQDPCNTWQTHMQMRDLAKATLEDRRDQMYEAMIEKLDSIYHE